MTKLEQEIIESLSNDNVKSFELLFKAYYTRLCHYAHSFVSDNMAAGDLVKDVFLKLWENRKSIVITVSLSSYLYRSVHNQCLNYIARTGKKLARFQNSIDETIAAGVYVPVSTDYPTANLLSKELESHLEQAIKKLPDHCREIFILSRVENLSHQQIAEKLNISENTVKVQIYRALNKLRKELKEFIAIWLLLSGL